MSIKKSLSEEDKNYKEQEVLEYDIIVKMERGKVHLLNYILEAEDNAMNIRSFEGEYLKVIAPKDTVIDAIKLLESVKEYVDLEIIGLRPNNGTAG
ncbi:MAG TPA: DUF4911 domain-containing protein [Fervidobacterium sp.]|nr:DUF4911 domain-containing protein [Fervidobacterium sp.]HOK87637.1 DUF4911 domain-containing protein [Fervidobacterium sp.]HOM73835.1 DUF4911 domain-containing protein [Fervidobacterium sp.]HOQ38808.1 DUF4911 domain-containing protein [Fervidobacterium sp.]HPP17606.1 DUF4911 domain-containing protein [Fervidobacterium sp.]